MKVESVHIVEQRNYKKTKEAECEACKVVGKKPMVVKVKVGGKFMGVVMGNISGTITSAHKFHDGWM